MGNSQNTSVRSTRLENDLLARVDAYGELKERTYNWIVRRALESFLNGIAGQLYADQLEVGMIVRQGGETNWGTITRYEPWGDSDKPRVTMDRTFEDATKGQGEIFSKQTAFEIRRG